MSRLMLAAAFLIASSATSIRAQPNDIAIQQANLQDLLNNAITALRNNDKATACQFQTQALGILSPNLAGFIANHPTNNWTDLQASLQDSVNACQAEGR